MQSFVMWNFFSPFFSLTYLQKKRCHVFPQKYPNYVGCIEIVIKTKDKKKELQRCCMLLAFQTGMICFDKKHIDKYGKEFVVTFEGCKKKYLKEDEAYGKVLFEFDAIVKLD